jgi:hypothetical protein
MQYVPYVLWLYAIKHEIISEEPNLTSVVS